MQNHFAAPDRQAAAANQAAADEGFEWRGWMATAILVFVGVAVGGAVAAAILPRHEWAAPVAVADSHSAAAGQPAKVDTAASSGTTAKTDTPEPEPAAEVSPPRPAPEPPQPAKPKLPRARPVPGPTPRPAPEPAPAQPAQPEPPADQATPTPEKAKPAPAINPAKQAAYARATADARLAMWRRDLVSARQNLKTAQANRQTPAEESEAARLQLILEHLEEFWKGLRSAVAKLQSGDELELKDNRVIVVEASRNELLIHAYGRQQRYRIEAMPVALIAAIMDRSFSPTPGSKVIVGTFLAMDREGDRARARFLWEDAAKHGESLGKEFLPELNVPPPNPSGGAGGQMRGLGNRTGRRTGGQ